MDSTTEELEETPSIEDLQEDGSGLWIDDIGEPYIPATGIPHSRLADHDTQSTLAATIYIVEQEGPIHQDLLSKRIIENSDVTHQGRKVSQTIDQAVSYADQNDRLDKRGDFLYPPSFHEFSIRRRDGVAANINWIPEGEIEEAINTILELQYQTPEDELVMQVAKVLGFSRTGPRISNRVCPVIERMVQEGSLENNAGRLSTSNAE